MPHPDTIREGAAVLDRRDGPHGEVVLRRRGEQFEIIANGCFLMDTSDGRSERLLVTAALDALGSSGSTTVPGRPATPDILTTHAPHLLIGGLGVGFSLAQAAADPRPGRITVVERETAVIDWHRTGDAPLARFAGTGHRDPRTRIVHEDLLLHLRSGTDRYDALCLDIDNGPEWTVTEGNDGLYTDEGLTALRGALAPGGVLAVWSAAPAPAFERLLRSRFHRVEQIQVTVKVERGHPDVIYLATREP
ncbi:spermidine synthase [Streptacidiphilus sp. EB129]|uniref:spermidine synthase n=1 Tax=Streptacidiphilus sp. EB129 TaxID=3156262 RepID=UPI003519536F